MRRQLWLWTGAMVCLAAAGCHNETHPKKPDPTKGTVTGLVICADTGKPARFAEVTLTGLPDKDEKSNGDGEAADPLNASETATNFGGGARAGGAEVGGAAIPIRRGGA